MKRKQPNPVRWKRGGQLNPPTKIVKVEEPEPVVVQEQEPVPVVHEPKDAKRIREATALSGRTVTKMFVDPASGLLRPFQGTATYVPGPSGAYGHCFTVTYEDGDKETMTLAAVKKHLLPYKRDEKTKNRRKTKKDFKTEMIMV